MMEKRSPDEDSSRRVEAFLEVLGRVPPAEVEAALSSSGIAPTADVAELVLKSRLCYVRPKSAVRFFRWAALSVKHTAYAWNLLVDILGRNAMFEPMWDAIRSMKQEGPGLLSVATFASVFTSYCAHGNFKDALMAFDVMDRYGVPQDVVALNSVLSAMCRQDGRTQDAQDLFDRAKARIAPDADTFAILLEGWEKEGDLRRAKSTFGEMVVRVGWDAKNMPAYDAFLSTLVRGDQADEALKFLQVMRTKSCLPGLKFFSNALDVLFRKRDYTNAIAFWYIMVSDGGLVPNLLMYNAIITLCCDSRDTNSALRLLDEMPFNGVFPDSVIYNTILGGLVKQHKAREAEGFLTEMRKNEQLPSTSNCAEAIAMFFQEYNPSAALDVWHCVVEHHIAPVEDSARELLVGLLDFGRFTDVRMYADEMFDMGIELPQSTFERMKSAFHKAGRYHTYQQIERRIKWH